MTSAEPSSPAAEPSADDARSRWRLPTGVIPSHYRLHLEPDLDAATFTGRCATDLRIETATDSIVCNSLELDILGAGLSHETLGTLKPTSITIDADTERVIFGFGVELPPGTAVLEVDFAGSLGDKLRGFYRSTFIDADGIERAVATTQFEATDARRAFPCWDEPDFKASFGVTLVVDHDHLAISNAAEIERMPDPHRPGRDIVRFADTMRMSTYLVAFVIGPLEATDPVDVDGTPLRVVFPRGKGHLTGHALEVGAFCLRFFADYYDIPYPGDKLDLVAIPDFAFGAMENLGCITFREILLLVDPANTTQAELLNVTDVINHELAHMWFGDLVTMKWWNGIWLNEAFATFAEMLATDAFRPEWERWVTFGLARTAAFDTDALTSTRPIEYPVISPADAEGMFDILTYEKGAAVVRMLETYLGPEAFRDGIRAYLRAHSYGNTETTDLWDAIEATTGEPVRRIMDSWIFQGGFPVIDVELVNDGRTLRLSQRRFGYAGDLGDGIATDPAHDETLWSIPLLFSQRSATDGLITFERVLMDRRSMDIDLVEPASWIFVNTEGTGFYRANYAPDLRAALATHLSDLSPIERYGLLDDTWASVLADENDAASFLRMLDAFAAETDLSVWQRMIAALGALDRLVEGDERELLQKRVRGLVAPALARLGDEPRTGESDRDRALRGALFEALGTLGNDPEARARARVLVDMGDLAGDAALRAAAVTILASHGGQSEFDEFQRRMTEATTPQETIRMLGALAEFPGEEQMRQLLNLTLTDSVRSQDAPLLLRRALTNRHCGAMAWHFIAAEWESLNQRLPSNSIARLLEGIRHLSDPAVAPEVFVFFETHEVPQGDLIVAQHLERLEVNVALRQRESARFGHALRQH